MQHVWFNILNILTTSKPQCHISVSLSCLDTLCYAAVKICSSQQNVPKNFSARNQLESVHNPKCNNSNKQHAPSESCCQCSVKVFLFNESTYLSRPTPEFSSSISGTCPNLSHYSICSLCVIDKKWSPNPHLAIFKKLYLSISNPTQTSSKSILLLLYCPACVNQDNKSPRMIIIITNYC